MRSSCQRRSSPSSRARTPGSRGPSCRRGSPAGGGGVNCLRNLYDGAIASRVRWAHRACYVSMASAGGQMAGSGAPRAARAVPRHESPRCGMLRPQRRVEAPAKGEARVRRTMGGRRAHFAKGGRYCRSGGAGRESPSCRPWRRTSCWRAWSSRGRLSSAARAGRPCR